MKFIIILNKKKDMDIKERLNLFISSKGLSNRAFEEICKIGNGASGMNKNKNGMQTAKVEKIISTFPELNADWLITGRGSMIYRESANNAYAIGDGSTNNAVAEGNVYAHNTEYLGSLKAQIEQLKKIVELQDEKIKMMEGGGR